MKGFRHLFNDFSKILWKTLELSKKLFSDFGVGSWECQEWFVCKLMCGTTMSHGDHNIYF